LSPALFALKPGDRVNLTDRPKGKFLLEPSASCHLMVATVTGIAPLRSMLCDALHRGVGGEFVVLHGASYADELPYFDEMTALAAANAAVTYVPTVSRPTAARNAGWTHDVGRVDDLACRIAPTLDVRHTHVYACGHPEMVQRVRGELGASFPVSTEVFD
jgi:NAD(P)H-flavin reductase